MGKRKIDILPIKDERNRKVTFVKRKAGLFKKAHELAVLCQADLAVIIIGNNHKLFEYSSMDMKDLLERYHQYDKPNESKKPQDFGDYETGSRIQGAGSETPATRDESEDDDEDEPSRKRSRSERDEYTPSKQLGQPFMSQQQQPQSQPQQAPPSVSKRPHLRVKIPQDMPIKKEQSSEDSATPQKLSASNNTNITSSDTQRRDSAKSTPLSATIPNGGIFGMSQFSPSQQLPLPTRNGFPLYSATTNNNGNNVRPIVGGEQQTPMSALPSKYVNDLFPSPNNFYSNEWNIPFGTGNTPLPSSAQHLLPIPNGTPQWAQQGSTGGGGANGGGTANQSAANSANSRFMFTRASSNYSEMLPSPLQMMMGNNNQFSQYETPAKKKPK